MKYRNAIVNFIVFAIFLILPVSLAGAENPPNIVVFVADENLKIVESLREKLDAYRAKSYFMYAQ